MEPCSTGLSADNLCAVNQSESWNFINQDWELGNKKLLYSLHSEFVLFHLIKILLALPGTEYQMEDE